MTIQLDTERPAPQEPEVPDLDDEGTGGRADRAFRRVALLAGATVLLILLLIAVVTTNKAWPAFSELGTELLLRHRVDPVRRALRDRAAGLRHDPGVAHRHRHRRARQRRHRAVRHRGRPPPAPGRLTTTIDLLAAVPSVVFGLWGFYYLIPRFQSVFNSISDAVSGIPVLNTIFGPATGLVVLPRPASCWPS